MKKRKGLKVWVSRDRGFRPNQVQFWLSRPYRCDPDGWFDGLKPLPERLYDWVKGAFRLSGMQIQPGQCRAFRFRLVEVKA